MSTATSPQKVVYLIGAGASHASVKSVGSPYGILMQDLALPLLEELRKLKDRPLLRDSSLEYLVNSVIDEDTDFEHIISFLDDAPSLRHRQFANEMRRAFEKVLRNKLNLIDRETKGGAVLLFKVLIDMYSIKDFPEALGGIITTNYDEFIEKAIKQLGHKTNFGINVESPSVDSQGILLLKLHGSFGWRSSFPITQKKAGGDTLWIPPGINKAKQAYPFNVLWGLARQVLSCDVLRIVGCSLRTNDWDLISMVFAMRHVNSLRRPAIEVIDSPSHVQHLKALYPYLAIHSMLEAEPAGSKLVEELTGGARRQFLEFNEDEQEHIIDSAGSNNWFHMWLRARAEAHYLDYGDVMTKSQVVHNFLEA